MGVIQIIQIPDYPEMNRIIQIMDSSFSRSFHSVSTRKKLKKATYFGTITLSGGTQEEVQIDREEKLGRGAAAKRRSGDVE
jgi:hypothetical protein